MNNTSARIDLQRARRLILEDLEKAGWSTGNMKVFRSRADGYYKLSWKLHDRAQANGSYANELKNYLTRIGYDILKVTAVNKAVPRIIPLYDFKTGKSLIPNSRAELKCTLTFTFVINWVKRREVLYNVD